MPLSSAELAALSLSDCEAFSPCPDEDPQDDQDADGLVDPCDPCPADPDNDAEADGFCADVDNCPDTANATQEDADGDGLGDVCDDDNDGDGVDDGVDNCPSVDNPGQEDVDGDGEGDACDPDGEFGYTPSNIDPALVPDSTDDVVLACGTSEFDSTALTYTNWCGAPTPSPIVQSQPGGPDLVVIPLASLTLASGARLRLVGNRPVVFAVRGSVLIDGIVDVDASGATPGAGGNDACGSSAGNNGLGDASTGGGGGGGGALGASGGNGGSGDGSPGGAGGFMRGSGDLSPLLAGCPGGVGGGCGGSGGAGGGAVQFSASAELTLTGQVVASGADGSPGCGTEGGGDGGGSGGAILLEAASLTTALGSVLVANGGRGGDSDGSGGAGGTGSSSAQNGQSHGANGGGGGGGSVGRIHLRGTAVCSLNGSPSPTPILACP